MVRFVSIAAAAALFALAAPADAQQRRDKPPEIPKSHRPPAGMCRIWLEGVAPNQQPAPTDCPSAVRNKPQNGWVIFGDDYKDDKKKPKLPPPKRLRGDPDQASRLDSATEARLLARLNARYEAEDARDLEDDELDTNDSPDRRQGAGRDVCIDRDRDGRCDDLARDSDGCVDRDGDGRCDDARYDRACGRRDRYGRPFDRRCDYDDDAPVRGRAEGDGICIDRNRDGRCDEPWSERYATPQTLPDMYAAVLVTQGQASYDVERWLRSTSLQPRIQDVNGDGDPEKVTWLDERGRVVQIWTELNGDGIADRVEFYENGRRVRVIGR